MNILSFIIQLAGATMLLLYAVRMVRTGIERAFGPSFRRVVLTAGNSIKSAFTGVVLAVILQSSAAVALLVAGFVGSGMLSFYPGLVVVLGADLGSALLIQVLSFDLDWLVPALLAIGGGLFIKSDQRRLKQAGRIILGIAFILISLRFLRETMIPIRDSDFLPAIGAFLARDFISAFLVGSALAFIMHSSVAVVLMCVTLVAIGAMPLTATVSLVLGANLGSAIIPIWLSRGMGVEARRVPLANFIMRGTGAIIALFLINHLPLLAYFESLPDAQIVINVHILFNLTVLLAMPFGMLLEVPVRMLLPDESQVIPEMSIEHRSALDSSVLETPSLAIASLKRELLRMGQLVEIMATPVMDIYASGNGSHIQAICNKDRAVNSTLDGIRRYVATLPTDKMKPEEVKNAHELTEYAIALETAGDIIAKRLMPLAKQIKKRKIRFSDAGKEELIFMHERVLANMGLASNVLISDDMESARLLVEEKTEMTRIERSSRKKHLKRLSDGAEISFDSSDVHLETLRSLKDINSQISMVAYPILFKGGQLLETRLITGVHS